MKTPLAQRGKPLFFFGPFMFDPTERRLEREGRAVPLTPRMFALLLALVEHAGHLMTKESLLQRIWPDTVVQEANLPVQVSRLRRLLVDGRGDVRYVETVPRFGYRFVAPVRVSAPAGTAPVPAESETSGDPRDGRGTIPPSGGRVRLTIQLTRVQDGETLWTEAVEGILSGPLGVEERMAEEVAEVLARLKVARWRRPGSE
jgi:DNA-binding winged helix-turn-helix (wHTH) protein